MFLEPLEVPDLFRSSSPEWEPSLRREDEWPWALENGDLERLLEPLEPRFLLLKSLDPLPRRFSFSALVAVGDQKGNIGVSLAKANEVAEAIRKAFERAKSNMVKVPIENGTLPHDIVGEWGAGRVLMRPAAPGTGVIAGGPVRAVLEAAGVTDVLTKSLGTNNPINVVRATMNGLEELVTAEQAAEERGVSVETLRAHRG